MNQHASSSSRDPVAEPSHAERVRTLLQQERVGTLATNSRQHPGFPFASVMPFALTEGGSPVFLISSMAVHTQNLVSDPRASLLVMQTSGDSDPLGQPRVTLIGSARKIDDVSDDVRNTYLERHPSARHWISFSDFAFFQFDVAQIYFVGGFGVMGWVEADAYASAEADPLMTVAAGIIEHMNRDHADAVRNIARRFGGLDAQEATMVSCDRLGFTVRVRTAEGMKGARISFGEDVRTSADARRVLVAMAKEARKSE
jgi:heme iron utilization protein